MDDCLNKACSKNWAVNFLPDDKDTEENAVQSTYINYFKNLKTDLKDIVYLTADSENIINELDPKKAYIIGGIVDRNRYIRLTYDKAIAQGIGHAKLPIGDHLKLTTSAVLAVNHVFEIVAEQFNIKDWSKTLYKVIPGRKIKSEETMNKI